jgi:hypothetical protein
VGSHVKTTNPRDLTRFWSREKAACIHTDSTIERRDQFA